MHEACDWYVSLLQLFTDSEWLVFILLCAQFDNSLQAHMVGSSILLAKGNFHETVTTTFLTPYALCTTIDTPKSSIGHSEPTKSQTQKVCFYCTKKIVLLNLSSLTFVYVRAPFLFLSPVHVPFPVPSPFPFPSPDAFSLVLPHKILFFPQLFSVRKGNYNQITINIHLHYDTLAIVWVANGKLKKMV